MVGTKPLAAAVTPIIFVFFSAPQPTQHFLVNPKASLSPQLQSYLSHDCSRRMQSATQKGMFCKRSLKHAHTEWTALNPKGYVCKRSLRVHSSQPKRVCSASAHSNMRTQSGQLSTQQGMFCQRSLRVDSSQPLNGMLSQRSLKH